MENSINQQVQNPSQPLRKVVCDRARILFHLFLFHLLAFSLSNFLFVISYPLSYIWVFSFFTFHFCFLIPHPRGCQDHGTAERGSCPWIPSTAMTEPGASTSLQGVSSASSKDAGGLCVCRLSFQRIFHTLTHTIIFNSSFPWKLHWNCTVCQSRLTHFITFTSTAILTLAEAHLNTLIARSY